MESKNLHNQIIVNSNASDAEVAAIKGAAVEAGIDNVSIEKTGGTTALGADGAPEVILLLKYAGGAFAGGILAAIGADVWKKIKKFVTTTFKKYKEEFNSEEQWFYNPIIVVDLRVNEESRVQMHFPRRDEEELKKSTESLQEILSLYNGEDFIALKFDNGKWIKTAEKFKSQEQIRDEIFRQQDSGVVLSTKAPRKPLVFGLVRLALVLFFVFGSASLITHKLTPPDYTIRFKRECDGMQCQKIKAIDSDRNTNIENDIKFLSAVLERFDFFARFTFLRFDFQTTNQSQFIFAVTEPKYEKRVDIMMQCNLNGQNYVFSPNSGIIFKQKSSLGNIVKELGTIQGVLINCNPAPQDVRLIPTEQVVVAPNAQVQFIYNEEKYHLRFLPDKWNYPLTVLQIAIILGIFLGAYYDLKRFIERGLGSSMSYQTKNQENKSMEKNIQELHKLIIDAGRSGDATKLNISGISDYHHMATELLLRPLPVGKENRCDFLKGLVLLENGLRLGSTSPLHNFMKRLDLYDDKELMDWIFANRNNPYIPFGLFHPPLEVRSYSEYLEYEKGRQAHREKMVSLDSERSRLAKERKEKIREEHVARKKENDEKRKRNNNEN